MACLTASPKFLCFSTIEDTLVVPFDSERKYSVLINSDEKQSKEVSEQTSLLEENYDGSVPSVSAAFSPCGKLFACCSQKSLSIWNTLNWSNVCRKTIHRSCSKIIFTPSCDAIVVADKSGDVHLHYLEETKGPSLLLLGHVSMLLDILIPGDGKYVISCDRDEKIRVSNFPDAYNIVSYCLGHEDCVTSINLLPNDSRTLLSSGGDGTFRLWDYANGKELLCYEVKDSIQDNNDLPLIYNTIVFSPDEVTTVVCSLIYKTSAVWVHSIKYTDKFSFNFIHNVCTQSDPYCLEFLRSSNILWFLQLNNDNNIEALIFESNKLIKFSDDCTNRIKEIVLNLLKDSYKKNLLDKKISSLYKKKFDNESEYNKRKIERLEAEKNKKIAKFPVLVDGKC